MTFKFKSIWISMRLILKMKKKLKTVIFGLE